MSPRDRPGSRGPDARRASGAGPEAPARDSGSFILTGSTVVAHVDLARELWPAVVDPGQVAQVIQNLVLSARTSAGGNIRVTAEDTAVHAL